MSNNWKKFTEEHPGTHPGCWRCRIASFWARYNIRYNAIGTTLLPALTRMASSGRWREAAGALIRNLLADPTLLCVVVFEIWLVRPFYLVKSLASRHPIRGTAALNGLCIPALVVSTGLLLPPAGYHLCRSLTAVVADLRTLAYVPVEERRLQTYGDRAGMGYGYLRNVVAGIPEPDIFPVCRFRHPALDMQILMSNDRWRIDPRILVGIDLSAADTRESVVTAATPVSKTMLPGSSGDRWVFQTGDDYDALTGLRLRLDPAAVTADAVVVTLRDRPQRPTVLGAWRIPLHRSSTIDYKLPAPHTPFSFFRGATNFILETASGGPIRGIEIRGLKVDLERYTVVHRSGSCWTALETAFLDHIRRKPLPAWERYIQTLRSATQTDVTVQAAPDPLGEWWAVRSAASLSALLLLPLAAGGWLSAVGWPVRWWVGMALLALVVLLGHMVGARAPVVVATLVILSVGGIQAARRRGPHESATGGTAVATGLIALLGIAAAAAVLAHPVYETDAVAIWCGKVRCILSGRPLATTSAPNYPILGPSFEAILVSLAGNEAYGRLLFPAAYVFWMLSVSQICPRPGMVTAPWLIPLVAWAGFDSLAFTSGYQDGFLMATNGMAALYLCRSLLDKTNHIAIPDLALAFLAAACLIKTEGTISSAILLGSFTLVTLWNRPVAGRLAAGRAILPRLAAFVAAAAAWPLLLTYNGMDARQIQGESFSWRGLLQIYHQLNRIPIIWWRLGAAGHPYLPVFVAALATSGVAVFDSRVRPAILTLWSAGLGHLGAVTTAFLATEANLEWHLSTAGGRLLLQGLYIPLILLALGLASLIEHTRSAFLSDRT